MREGVNGQGHPRSLPPDRWQQWPLAGCKPPFIHLPVIMENSLRPSTVYQLLRAGPKTDGGGGQGAERGCREAGGERGTDPGCVAGKEKRHSECWRCGQPARLRSFGVLYPTLLLGFWPVLCRAGPWKGDLVLGQQGYTEAAWSFVLGRLSFSKNPLTGHCFAS